MLQSLASVACYVRTSMYNQYVYKVDCQQTFYTLEFTPQFVEQL